MASIGGVTSAETVFTAARIHLKKLRRFARSPKGYLLVALTALAAVAAPAVGVPAALLTLAWSVLGATGMELLLNRIGGGGWRFPSSALLTGLIVGLVLGTTEPWYAALVAGMLAIDAKHLLRLGRTHIFNPAALGLVAVSFLFGSGQSWWGALPDLPMVALVLLLAAAYLVADRANKLPAALGFLGVFVALGTGGVLLAGAGTIASLGELFRVPLLNAALFFAAFMVTDPPTSPVAFAEQAVFGGLVAAASFGIYLATRGIYYLPLGLLVGNAVWAFYREAKRLWTRRGTGTIAAQVERREPFRANGVSAA
jgi:Na+-translocating ferredoxin:NAD+ oxidoreductase RnfD subunit